MIGDEEDKPDAAGGALEEGEPLPEQLTEEQTIWFDAVSEGNLIEIKELLDSGSDSAWKNKVCITSSKIYILLALMSGMYCEEKNYMHLKGYSSDCFEDLPICQGKWPQMAIDQSKKV